MTQATAYFYDGTASEAGERDRRRPKMIQQQYTTEGILVGTDDATQPNQSKPQDPKAQPKLALSQLIAAEANYADDQDFEPQPILTTHANLKKKRSSQNRTRLTGGSAVYGTNNISF